MPHAVAIAHQDQRWRSTDRRARHTAHPVARTAASRLDTSNSRIWAGTHPTGSSSTSAPTRTPATTHTATRGSSIRRTGAVLMRRLSDPPPVPSPDTPPLRTPNPMPRSAHVGTRRSRPAHTATRSTAGGRRGLPSVLDPEVWTERRGTPSSSPSNREHECPDNEQLVLG